MADWHTLASARSQWDGAPLDDDVLTSLLEIAKSEVIAYAPSLPDDEDEDLDGGDPFSPGGGVIDGGAP